MNPTGSKTLRSILGISLIVVVVISGYSQSSDNIRTKKIDSLQLMVTQLRGAKQVDVLNSIAFEWFGLDDAKANEAASEALALSEKIQYNKGRSEALIYKGLYARFSGEMDLALAYLREGTNLARKSGNKQIEGYGLIQLATVMSTVGKTDSSLLLFEKSYALLKDSLYPLQLSSLYKNWGLAYSRQLEHDKARSLLFKALAIRKLLHDEVLLIDVYLSLSEYYLNETNLEMANQLIVKADSLSRELDSASRINYEVKYHKALLLIRQSRYTESYAILNELKQYYGQYKSKQEYVKLLSDIGFSLVDLGNYEFALDNYYQALSIAEAGNMTQERARLYWQLALVHNNLKQHNEAKQFARKSLQVANANNFIVEEATAYNLLGLVLASEGSLDSALIVYKKALTLRERIKDNVRIASTLGNIGDVLKDQGNYVKAIDYWSRAHQFMLDENNMEGTAWTSQALGELFVQTRQLNRAKIFLDMAEEKAKQVKSVTILQDVYKTKASYFESSGSLNESLRFYKLYSDLRDSVYSASLSNRLVNLHNEFNVLQKNQQIELLNRDKALREQELQIGKSQINQQRIVIFSGVVMLVLVLAVAYAFYTNYKSESFLNQSIQEKNEEIQSQAEELHSSNQMIMEINANLEQQVESRTTELKQAYKELDTFFYRSSHDFRRPLTTFMGLAEVAKIAVKEEQALQLFEKVNETARSLDRMLIKLQSVSDLGSTNLIYKEIFFQDIINMVVESLQEEIANRKINIVQQINPGHPFYSYPALLKIIVENLIENAITFSAPGAMVTVKVYSEDSDICLEVSDNGFGIDDKYINRVFEMYFRANERSKGNGLGLYIVKRMVEKLGGKIVLKSELEKGTVVLIKFKNEIN